MGQVYVERPIFLAVSSKNIVVQQIDCSGMGGVTIGYCRQPGLLPMNIVSLSATLFPSASCETPTHSATLCVLIEKYAPLWLLLLLLLQGWSQAAEQVMSGGGLLCPHCHPQGLQAGSGPAPTQPG